MAKPSLVTRCLSVLLMAGVASTPHAMADPVAPAHELDFGSVATPFHVADDHLSGPVAIRVGRITKVVGAGDHLTAAEYAAFMQVIQSGTQRIVLDTAGRAVAGTVALNGLTSNALSGLAVPSGLTALHDFGIANLSISGNLTNSGKFFAVSTNAAVNTASISAASILNKADASITTVLPSSGLPGFSNAIADLNLRLSALSTIVNEGTISSAGDLVVAADAVINGSGAVSQTAARMTAAGNLTILAPSVSNSGIIEAPAGNLNIFNQAASDLRVEGKHGAFIANRINLGDALATINLNVKGGDWFSSQLFASASQMVDLHVGELTGSVDITAESAHIGAATELLRLDRICLTGDPLYYNLTGSIALGAGHTLSTNGADLAIVAARDIVTSGVTSLSIDTSSAGGGGDLIMVAGADFFIDVGNGDVVILGASPYGGQIDLTSFSGGQDIDLFTTAGTSGNAKGGNVTLVAFEGTDPMLSGTFAGKISLPPLVTVRTGGSGTGANGDVVMIAGSASGGTSLGIGFVDTSGGTGEGGRVQLSAAMPVLELGPIEIDQFGSKVSLSYFDIARNASGIDESGLRDGSIVTSGITFSGSGGVELASNGAVFMLGGLTYAPNGRDGIDYPDTLQARILGSNIISLYDIDVPRVYLNANARAGEIVFEGNVIAGAVQLGAVSGGGGTGNVSVLGNIVTTGDVWWTPTTGPLLERTGNTVNASGDISIGGFVCCNSAFMTAGGDIGSQSAPITMFGVSAASASAGGSAYLVSSGDLNLLATSRVGNSADSVLDVRTTNDGNLVLINNNFLSIYPGAMNWSEDTPLSTVRLVAGGSGSIHQSGATVLSAGKLILESGSGDIGQGQQHPLFVNAAEIEVSTSGNAYLANPYSPLYDTFSLFGGDREIGIVPETNLSQVEVGAGKTFMFLSDAVFKGSVPGELIPVERPANVRISSSIPLKNGTDYLVSGANDVQIDGIGATDINAVVNLSVVAGADLSIKGLIATGLGSNLSVEAGRDIFLGADMVTAGGGSVSAEAGRNIFNIGSGGRFGATTVALSASAGDIGTSESAVRVHAVNLGINDSDKAFIVNENHNPLSLGIVNSANLELITPGDVSTNNVIAGGSISITSEHGSIDVRENINPFDRVRLSAENGSVINDKTVRAHNGDVEIFALELENNGLVAAGSAVMVSSPVGHSLTLRGNGNIQGQQISVAAPGGLLDQNTIEVAPGSNQSLSGETTFIANGDYQPPVNIGENASVTVDSPVTIFGNGYSGALSAPLTKLVTPRGAGVIANPYGDTILNGNITVVGHHLAVLSPGNIRAYSTTSSINLSNPSGFGGNVTLIAGYDFTESPAFTGGQPPQRNYGILYTITEPSQSGGSVLLPGVAITTTSGGTSMTQGKAGDVVAVAHAGQDNAGVVLLKSVTAKGTASNGIGGDVTLIGQGGVKVGGIDTSAAFGGNVTILGAEPVIVGGPMLLQDGYIRSGARFSALPFDERAGAAIYVNGPIKTTGSNGTAGDIYIGSDSLVKLTGGITATGLTATGPSTAGGAVFVESHFDNILITGIVNVSGLDNLNAAIPTGASAGAFTAYSPSFISVGSNILANGGKTSGTGNGGAAGLVALATSDHDHPDGYYGGSIRIGGTIHARGGNGSTKISSNGGDGGLVVLSAGTVQVLGTTNGSINVMGGNRGNTFAQFGDPGFVLINTYAVQQFPSNMNLISSALTEAALPGGQFTVGAPKTTTGKAVNVGAPVNGTAGSIIAGSTLSVANLIDQGIDPEIGPLTHDGIVINVTGGAQTIRILSSGGVNDNPVFSDKIIAPRNPDGSRVMVTPATAVALYQVSNSSLIPSVSQSLGVSGANGTAVSVRNNFGDGSRIIVKETDIRTPFKNFNLLTSDGLNRLVFQVEGQRPRIDLSSAGTVHSFGGDVSFSTLGTTASVNLGGSALKMTATGSFFAPQDSTLLFTTSAAAPFINAGTISANAIAVLSSATSGGSVKFNNLNNVIESSFGSNARIVIPRDGLIANYSFINTGGQFVPICFEPLQLPLSHGPAAERTFPTLAVRNVVVDVANSATGAGSSFLPGTGVLRGEIIGSNVTIRSVANAAAAGKPATNLMLDGGYISASKAATVDSAGNLGIANTFVGGFGTMTVQASGDINVTDSSLFSTKKGTVISKNGGIAVSGSGQFVSFTESLDVTAKTSLALSSGTTMWGMRGLNLKSSIDDVHLRGNVYSDSGPVKVSAGKDIIVQSILRSGELKSGFVPETTLSPTDLATNSNGSARKGSISLIAGNSASPGKVLFRAGTDITVNGGDITAVGWDSIAFESRPVSITANGGNIRLFSKNDVTGVAGVPALSLLARAIGTSTSSTGGGVQVAAGVTTSTLLNAALGKSVPNTVNPSTLGTNVVLDNNGGTSGWLQVAGPGIVELSTFEQASLNQNGGAIVFSTQNAGNKISFDGVDIETFGFKPGAYVPIGFVQATAPREGLFVYESASEDQAGASADCATAYDQSGCPQTLAARCSAGMPARLACEQGEYLIKAHRDLIVESQSHTIRIRKGALVAISANEDGLRVGNIGAVDGLDIAITSKANTFVKVSPNTELLITEGQPPAALLSPSDGVGRRHQRSHSLSSGHCITTSDISVISFLREAGSASAIRLKSGPLERKLFAETLKSAAAYETVTRTRGAFRATARNTTRKHNAIGPMVMLR